MTALWKHLKPVPYNTAHSHATLRILGKLGGRNRRILLEAANLKFNDRPDGVLLVPVPFKGKEKPCLLQLDTCLMTVRKILKDSSHSSERMLQQAFAFITGTLPLLVDAREGSTNLARYIAENVRTPSTKDSLEAARASMKQMEERLDKDTANFVTRHDSFIDIAKRDAQSETLTALIECAFLAAASPKLQEQARPYLDHLTRHFTLLKVAESAGLSPRALRTQRIYQGIDFIDASCYLDSIMVTLASPSQDVRKVAEESLELVVATATLLMGSVDAVPRLAMINALATKCTSSCYSTDWFKKMAGCRGIHFLSSRAALGPAWLLDYVVEFSKGLLNILKDMPAEYVLGAGALRENISHHSAHSLVGKYVPEIQTTLSGILRSVEITTADAGLQEKRLSRRSILLNLLVTELSSSHVAVRDLVHDILQLLAELTGDSVSSILEPVKTRLLAPIFSKPLRALPFPMQIGNIDAIAYCLRLDPPLVSFNEELIRLLHETLAIADADDQALTSKASQHKHSSS